MLDFDVQRCTRRCCKTDREFLPGEPFYSVLMPEGGSVVRYDYAQEAWQGAPEGAIGCWKSQMPDASARKLHWAPHDVLLHYFEQLENQPEKQDVRYVLTLLLLRRRIVRPDSTQEEPGPDQIVVYCPRNETQYVVKVADPSPERIELIQQELAQLLFASAER